MFFERYPLVLMPVSWQRPVRQDMDTGSVEDMRALVAAQSPLLATAGLGVPGLSVPTGLAGGVPMGCNWWRGASAKTCCCAPAKSSSGR